MSVWILVLGNAAAVAPKAGASVWSKLAPATLPDWFLVVLAVLGVAAAFLIYNAVNSITEKMPDKKKDEAKEFTRMLCDQVWRHTDFMTNVFAQRLRQEPTDLTSLHVLLRNLREDMAAPIHFIDQMLGQAPSNWPNYALLGAFSNWAGQLKSMASQLADHQGALNYSPAKDAADKYRDQMLVYKFLTERTILSRGVSQLRSNAFSFCEATKKSLEKSKKKSLAMWPSDEEKDKEDHPECPCCKHRHEHIQIVAPDPLHIAELPIPPKPPAPPPPPPPAKVCCCSVPVACHCARACACVCQCPPAQKPAAAA